MLSLDAALLHGLHALNKGYWPVVASLLDKDTLATVMSLPYATKPLTRGRTGVRGRGKGRGVGREWGQAWGEREWVGSYATKPLTRGGDGGARVGQGEGMGLGLGCEAVGGVLSHQAAHER